MSNTITPTVFYRTLNVPEEQPLDQTYAAICRDL
jgi:hypothetical protein